MILIWFDRSGCSTLISLCIYSRCNSQIVDKISLRFLSCSFCHPNSHHTLQVFPLLYAETKDDGSHCNFYSTVACSTNISQGSATQQVASTDELWLVLIECNCYIWLPFNLTRLVHLPVVISYFYEQLNKWKYLPPSKILMLEVIQGWYCTKRFLSPPPHTHTHTHHHPRTNITTTTTTTTIAI